MRYVKFWPETAAVPDPWHYVCGAVWTTQDGPEDGGACVALRASNSDLAPHDRDRALRLAAQAPAMAYALRELLAEHDADGRQETGGTVAARQALELAGVVP